MGKKGSWFSAIKRVFTSSNSKHKPLSYVEGEKKKSLKEDKGGKGRKLKHGSSFIPFFREPSSIEQILGEIDQQNLFIGNPPQQSQSQQPQPPPQPPPPPPPERQSQSQPSSSARPVSPPRVTPPPRATKLVHQEIETEISHTPGPTTQHHHRSATRIQAAYRGHMARKVRSYSTSGVGLERLQGVVKGQNVKRQTVNAMKQMQLVVRVQTQIQSRRIQMLENQALKQQANNNDKQTQSTISKIQSEMNDEYWDDSLITKEEREKRLQQKVEAVIKRERAMSYAYSHQSRKATPTSTQTSLIDMRTGGHPWWWNWLDRQLPPHQTQPIKTTTNTPNHKHLETPTTPKSSRSTAPSKSRTPPNRMMKYSKPKGTSSLSPYSLKDDDSMMSCPPFSAPNYMSPTVSAKAKARPTSNPRDHGTHTPTPTTPGSESSKRRFSFPFTPPNNNMNKWNNKHKSPRSIGDMSVDSAVSVPASMGRKPFNRFV